MSALPPTADIASSERHVRSVIAFYATSLCRSIARELLYAVEDASRQMKIVMMATGGVGGYYGARLAAANEDAIWPHCELTASNSSAPTVISTFDLSKPPMTQR